MWFVLPQLGSEMRHRTSRPAESWQGTSPASALPMLLLLQYQVGVGDGFYERILASRGLVYASPLGLSTVPYCFTFIP